MTDEAQPLPDLSGNEPGKTEYKVGRGKPPRHTQFGQPGATTKRGYRPKDFTAWRKMTAELLREIALDKNGNPIIIVDADGNEHKATNAEMIARSWIQSPKRQRDVIEAAFGKVPDEVRHIGDPSRPVVVKATQISDDDLAALIANLTTGSGE